jgi:pyruvate kinase
MITVGNKSNNLDFLRFAYTHGIRDFRINMDYAKDAALAFENLKKLEKDDINIYDDFQGDKFRIHLAEKKEEIIAHTGEKLRFYFDMDENNNYITHLKEQKEKISEGNIISIADGKLQAEIQMADDNYFDAVFTKVDYKLRNNAGLCFLGRDVPSVSMSAAVCKRILGTLEKDSTRMPQWVILSFVDSADTLKEFIAQFHSLSVKVMAKIETPQGIKNIAPVSRIVDGLMLGRGDLRNTAGGDYQKYYAQALEAFGRCPVTLFKGIGTFFLENFSETNNMSQEELSDINTVFQGNNDYFMLSKEVVNSKFPYETIVKAEKITKGEIL